MPVVSYSVSHIQRHIDGEAASTHSSQTVGMLERHAYVTASLDGLRTDSRNIPPQALYPILLAASPPGPSRASYARMLAEYASAADPWPQQAIQTWVEREEEA